MADNKPIDTGNKTVTGRTIWNDPETGEDYSERSTTFEIDGKFYTMPTVAENGSQYTEDQIRTYVKENGPVDYLTGEKLPEFRYMEDAIEYAISRSSTRKQTDMAQGGAIPMNNQMELFGEGGLKDEGGMVDEVSGNEVPVGGTKEGVRDDIPANVSEGEFIFPEDVVRFVGLDKLMQIRQDAKMGLKKMEAMGQMGNSDEATMDDDMPFGMADLIVVGGKGEPMEFADGGFVPVQNFQEGGQVTLPTAPVPTFNPDDVADYDAYLSSVEVTAQEYRNADGESMIITFINGIPIVPVQPGYTLYVPPEEGGEATEATEVVNTVNNNNNEKFGKGRNVNANNQEPTGINYAGMSDEEFLKRIEYENTKGYKIQRAVALGVTSLVPFGGALAYASMRGTALSNEARLKNLIASESNPAEQAKLNTLLEEFYKSNIMQDSSDAGAFTKWVDGVLVKLGFSPDQTKKAAEAAVVLSQNNLGNTEFDDAVDAFLKDKENKTLGRGNAVGGPATKEQLETRKKETAEPFLRSQDQIDETNRMLKMEPFAPTTKSTQLAPGDVVNINLSGGIDLNDNFKVLRDGLLILPKLPPIDAAGKTASEVEQIVSGLLKLGDDKRGTTSSASVSMGYKSTQTGDPNIVTDTNSVGQRPSTYDPAQFGSGEPAPAVEPVAAPPLAQTSIDDKFAVKTPYALGYPEGMKNLSGIGSVPPEQTLLEQYSNNPFKQKDIGDFLTAGRNAISSIFQPKQGFGSTVKKETNVTDQQLPESVPQQQSAFSGPTFDTAQQTAEAFDQGVSRSPVVATEPLGPSVLGGRGTINPASGTIVDPRTQQEQRNAERIRLTGYDPIEPTVNPTAPPTLRPQTRPKKVAPKKEVAPQQPTIEKLQFSNFKGNVITTASDNFVNTKGVSIDVNPEGTPGKNSVGAFRQGLYAGDGFEWREDGTRIYTGVNQGVTGTTDPSVASKPLTQELINLDFIKDLFGTDKKDKTSKDKPIVKTGDGGVAEAQAIKEKQARQSDDERQAEREAARAATKTTKASTKEYKTKKEARAATDKAVEKFGRATGGRAKGGLIDRPIKTKKTKKRGLAAR